MTAVVARLGGFLADHGLRVLVALGAAILVLGVVLRLALGPVGTRRLVCCLPIFGPLLRWLAIARFSTLLSLLVESRIPLDEALALAGEASGDAEIRFDCQALQTSVRAGKTLESAARAGGRFPKSFIRALGWERHQEGFPEVLHSMADMYAGRARALVAIVIVLLPPLVVSLVGIVVGLVIIGLFMPLFSLLKSLS